MLGGKRRSDKSCAQHHGREEIDGRMDLPKADGMAAEIGLNFVDILTSDNEPALTKLDRVLEHTESDEEWIEDDHRE